VEWKKLHNEEVYDLYSSPTNVRVVKLRRMILAGHVTLMGKGEACTGFWWGNLKERDHWRDPDVDGNIILRWWRYDVGVWTGLSWLRIETVGGQL
jgi:hypothetical protein